MDEIKINMIEKTDEGLVLKLPTTSVEQVKGLKEKLGEKVDKVEGKQLSTNDYSTEDKNKLAELENYDDTNIKTDIAKKADASTVDTNLSKKVDKVTGKGLSTNDYTDLEKSEVAKIKNLATNETVTEIKSDVENLKTSKVDKEVGKGLSTNDYTTAEKNKLSGIQAGAQANAVTSVAGRTGKVTITKSDVGLGAVNNVTITSAQVTKINELNYTRALTQAQYDALSTAEKNRTDVWYGIYKE